MGDSFGDAAESSEAVQAAASDDEEVGAGCRLDQSWDRGSGKGVRVSMPFRDFGEVDALASLRDDAS